MRFPFRRAIAFAIVSCQVMTAMVVHVPMAQAMGDAGHGAPVSHHCHDHSANAAGGHAGAAQPGRSHSDDSGPCKSGFCKCACAHVTALPMTIAPSISSVPHPPMTIVYSERTPSERPTQLFRPPI